MLWNYITPYFQEMENIDLFEVSGTDADTTLGPVNIEIDNTEYFEITQDTVDPNSYTVSLINKLDFETIRSVQLTITLTVRLC